LADLQGLVFSQGLVESKKRAVIESLKESADTADGDVAVGKKDLVGKDVLSSLSTSLRLRLTF
jgi:hypothetical protein